MAHAPGEDPALWAEYVTLEAECDRLTASLADSRRVAEQLAGALRGLCSLPMDVDANGWLEVQIPAERMTAARAALAAYDGADK